MQVVQFTRKYTAFCTNHESNKVVRCPNEVKLRAGSVVPAHANLLRHF
jgi:hypothetical protein